MVFYSACAIGNAQVDSLSRKSYQELVTAFQSAIEKDAQLAFQYAEAAHTLASSKNNPQQIGESLYFLAKANNDLSQNKLALTQLSKVIHVANQLKDSVLLFKGNVLRGNVYNDVGDESNALQAYLEAEKSSAFSEKSSDLILLFINIAFIKKLHKDYKDAVTIFTENLEQLQTITIDSNKKRRYELIILMNLTDTYLRMKEDGNSTNIEKAEYYNTIGLEKCGDDTASAFYNVLLMNKAIIQFEKEVYQESIAIAHKVKAKAETTNNEGLTCTAYFYLGKNYHRLEDYPESIRFFNLAYDIMKTSERKYSNETILHDLQAQNYLRIKDIDKAEFHLELFRKLIKAQGKKDLETQKTLADTHDQKIREERVKRLQNSLDELKQRKLFLYIISGVLVVLLLLSVVFYRRKVRKIKEKVAQVLEKVEILEKSQADIQKKPVKSVENITDEKALNILKKLEEFEASEAFLVQGCTLIYVAEQLNSNTTYLSKVINTYKGKTFNSYINELRINKALIQLKNDAKLRSYNIKGIAEEFGFKRQETFSRAFKQQTGIYPSQYLKKLDQTAKDD